MNKRDYYEILGVQRSATANELKKAYREIAKKYHPDRNPGDIKAEEQFKEASEAYEVLRDPEKRQIYDSYGFDGLRGRGFSGFSDMNDIFSSFGDIFENFFGFDDAFFGGGSRRRSGPVRGRDIQSPLKISFEEAYEGCEKEIDLEKYTECKNCAGSGVKPGTSPNECPTCRGQGRVQRSQGFFSVRTTCPECRGEGHIIKEYCQDCEGEGRILERKKLKVKIPAGIDSGISIRLSGEGEPGKRGGPYGDMFFEINVIPHETFERDESGNIISKEEISFPLAALGGEIEVETMQGKKTLKIDKGTQSGTRKKISNLGFPSLRGFGKADHIFHIFIKTPNKLSKKQKELLEEFDKLDTGKLNKQPKKKKGIFEKIFFIF